MPADNGFFLKPFTKETEYFWVRAEFINETKGQSFFSKPTGTVRECADCFDRELSIGCDGFNKMLETDAIALFKHRAFVCGERLIRTTCILVLAR